jgi:hypothetical protein
MTETRPADLASVRPDSIELRGVSRLSLSRELGALAETRSTSGMSLVTRSGLLVSMAGRRDWLMPLRPSRRSLGDGAPRQAVERHAVNVAVSKWSARRS